MNRLNLDDIQFITLQRRTPKLLQQIAAQPISAWQKIELKGVSRHYRYPKILDQEITLSDYDVPVRQLIAKDLGHEEPTILLTNQLKRGASTPIGRYAQRMPIENQIADSIDFFHMDALSSAEAMKVNYDLQLTLMAGSFYRLPAGRLGRGYEKAESRHLFSDIVDASATIVVDKRTIEVRFQKRAHNPLLPAAGFDQTDVLIPWLGGKRLRLTFG